MNEVDKMGPGPDTGENRPLDAAPAPGGEVQAVPAGTITGPGIFAELAALPKEALITGPALARALGICGRTLARSVSRGDLPPCACKIGGQSVWLVGRVLAHLDGLAERREQEASRASAKIRKLCP